MKTKSITMNIDIQSLHFKADETLKAFVLKKTEKLSRLDERILAADICLKTERSETTDNKICEIRLSLAGQALFASRKSKTFEQATSEAVEALKRQLRKRKTQMSKGRN
ncbi:MAG: ribosome-associated translation inhibitor RaiA [Bacteroidota bacterium]